MKKTTIAVVMALGLTTACAEIPGSAAYPGSVNSASVSSLQGDGLILGLIGVAVLSFLVAESGGINSY